MSEPNSWDDLYSSGDPPWDIGAPQPELVPYIGLAVDEVLDAGCGLGDLSIALGQQEFTVVGLDISQVAIDQATAKATQNSLATVTFAYADMTALTGYDGRFKTVFDCGLLSSLSQDDWPDYMSSLQQATSASATMYLLTRDEGSGGPTQDQLAQLFSDWTVNNLDTATVRCNASLADMFGMFPNAVADGDGYTIPGYLLTATKGTP